MPRLLPALLVAALLSCSTVHNAIWRAELGENIKNIWAGKDRGVNAYAATIDQFTSRGFENGRYAYVAPAYTSNFRVNWSVLGLGRTKTETAEELALVVDRLFYALARDPTGSVRARLATVRLPPPRAAPPRPAAPRSTAPHHRGPGAPSHR